MQRTADNPRHLHTTEWEDIQYQFGNRVGKYETHEEEILWRKASKDPAVSNRNLAIYDPKKEKSEYFRYCMDEGSSSADEETSSDEEETKGEVESVLDQKDTKKVTTDITEEEDESSVLEKIRKKRLDELKKGLLETAVNAGCLRSVSGSAYVKEVTEESVRFWVVAILVQPGESNCEALLSAMRTVAQRQRAVKFVSMVYTEVVGPTFPVQHLPCVLLYRHGKMQQQLTGPDHWKVRREMNCDQIEKTLRFFGVLSSEDDESEKEGP